MATFELERDCVQAETAPLAAVDTRRIKQECIIALKVYDQCRQPYWKIHIYIMADNYFFQ